MSKEALKLKQHETFSIREGWLEKGINGVANKETGSSCFKKELGTRYFGLGSNMVKSLKYWMKATGLLDTTISANLGTFLSPFGNLLFQYDPYLQDKFSWWLIHCNLVTNEKDAGVFNAFFNLNYNKFDKDLGYSEIKRYLEKNYEISSYSSLESDYSVVLKSYCETEVSNPEDNMGCPLSKLELVKITGKNMYVKQSPKRVDLDYRIVYHSLLNCYDVKEGESASFTLELIEEKENSPLKILNISKSTLFLYLDEMKNRGLIDFVKTAGLNVVTIEKALGVSELMRGYFEV